MRYPLLLLTLVLLSGCAASKPSEDEFVTRIGVITAKQIIDPEQAQGGRRTNTSASVSVSSGRGVSVGFGVLLGGVGSSSSLGPTVRYQVELMDGEKIEVNHESDQFLVDDCVEIRMVPGNNEFPAQMKRIEGGC
jgi:hypothetical protein